MVRGSSARQVAVDLAGDVALEHADDFALGATVFDPALHVGLGLRIRCQPGHHDGHRALLACRSPPRLSRWRVTLPEEASSGETPHRWAQAASERRRSGLSPAATSSAAAVSMPTP
jgi:hypothetical protein